MKPKARYFAETDTLAIEIVDRPASDAEEVADNVIVDFDAQGQMVGLTIEHASELFEDFIASASPQAAQRRAAAS